MLPGKPEDHKYYRGELGGQLGITCIIKIIESIMGSTSPVFDRYETISALRRAWIHLESVTLLCKQADLISCLFDVYHSIESRMALVHVYGHHNSWILASTLTPLASLNVQLDALEEYIIEPLLCLTAPRTPLVLLFSYPYGFPRLSNHRVPVHSNISQSIVYEISKHLLLQKWVDLKFTPMADWEGIELSPFEQVQYGTTVHISNFITKCMSSTLSTMTILQWQRHASTNLCQWCGLVLEMIHHMYQCTHEGSRDR